MRFSVPAGVVIHKGGVTVNTCSAQYLYIFVQSLQNASRELKWPGWWVVTWDTDTQGQACGMEQTPI